MSTQASSCSTGCGIDPGTPYYKKRYIFFLIATTIALVLPFITIDGNHMFLLSFEEARVDLAGVRFDIQEFYLMPFLLMLLFLFIFFITALGGRVWCGWACPQTIFRSIYRDLIEGYLLGMRKRKNKQKEPDYAKAENKAKKTIAILVWSALSLLAASNFTWYFVPPEQFFEYVKNPADHPVLMGMIAIISLFLIYDVVKLKEDFCSYVCPYVRIQSALINQDSVMTMYDTKRGGIIWNGDEKVGKKPLGEADECTGCEACVKVCPTHIDIRKGLQLECINCLECADACNSVMAALGKKSLVRWESEYSMENGKVRWFRFQTVAYSVLLIGITIALFVIGSTKEHMLLNINKSGRVYSIKDDKVMNDYQFLVTNTDDKEHKYFFEIVGRDDVVMSRPTEPFLVKSEGKIRKIVVLEGGKHLAEHEQQNTKVHLTIRAYALDEPEKIQVFRETIFVAPPKKELK